MRTPGPRSFSLSRPPLGLSTHPVEEAAKNPAVVEQTRDNLRLLGIFHILFGLMALPGLLIIPFHGMVMELLEQALAEGALPPEIEGMQESVRALVTTIFYGIIAVTLYCLWPILFAV